MSNAISLIRCNWARSQCFGSFAIGWLLALPLPVTGALRDADSQATPRPQNNALLMDGNSGVPILMLPLKNENLPRRSGFTDRWRSAHRLVLGLLA
jgi:hypothetical protein